MQQLIADYILVNKYCALPTIGTLCIKNIPAISILGEQKITAPTPTIVLESETQNEQPFIDFIAAQQKISKDDATDMLLNFVKKIENMGKLTILQIPDVGWFFKNELNEVCFETLIIPTQFLPAVNAVRIAHPNDSHSMMVGETETNTSTMAEYYAENATAKKSLWWVWAIAFFVISFIVIAYYFATEKNAGCFANIATFDIINADTLHKQLP